MAHILIVDDERDVVTLLKFLLQKEGHSVSEAFDGAQALDILGIEPAHEPPYGIPDLIIIDVMMPVMDGYTASLRIRQDPRTEKIPLIVLTAKGQVKDVFHALPGAGAQLQKPFDPKQLRELVAGLVAKKS